MIIEHRFSKEHFIYRQTNLDEIGKLSLIMINKDTDILDLGIVTNSSKFQGWTVKDNKKTGSRFKILDSVLLPDLNVKKVVNGGYYVERVFDSKFCDDIGEFEEIRDTFYLLPSGLVYEVDNYDGQLIVDLDVRLFEDFDKWGRFYDIDFKNNILVIKYKKFKDDKLDYSLFVGISSPNFDFDLIEEWVKKSYSYSKKRGSLSEMFVFRLLQTKVFDSRRVFFVYGHSEKEIFSKIRFLEMHFRELLSFEKDFFKKFEVINSNQFKKPLTADILNSYRFSIYNYYRMIDLNNHKFGFVTGIPWFVNKWTRDNLVALRGLINLSDFSLARKSLFSFLESINENGLLKRIIDEDSSLESPDGIFWLGKRFEDFIFKLSKQGRREEFLTDDDLNNIFERLFYSFKKIVERYWNSELELLKVNPGDSWMDTLNLDYPLDIQVQFLSFVSFLVSLSNLLGREKDYLLLNDFESGMRARIVKGYLRDGFLYSDLRDSRIDSNIFLIYYFYPELLSKLDWEKVFDKSIPLLRTTWGGFASVSKEDPNFCKVYSGEDDKSYHNGDSWFWINNIAGIVLNDLNELKYRHIVNKVILSSSQDILKFGGLGFGSEISSFENLSAEGCFAQLWSMSTFIELVDKIYLKK